MATKIAINQSLQKLCDETDDGDYLFLHFSCHGQQMMDLNGDEEDGLDEALIPYDALFWYMPDVYEGENHLCDDELGLWIYKLRCKAGRNGQVMVLLDACHSGTANRNNSSFYVRGVNKIFAPDDYFPQPGKYLEHSFKLKNFENMAPALVLSACNPDETNYEYFCRKDMCYYGKLTYSFVQVVKEDLCKFTAEELLKTVEKTMQKLSRGSLQELQHPYMECSNKELQFTLPVVYK